MTGPDAVLPDTVNPPGQPRLRRGVGGHPRALARMRDELAATAARSGNDLGLRALARLGTDDPSIALLDAWALVADTVSFYNERIVNEGYLRTATQPRSVRELSRTLGYELRPGVAAQADLVFTVESAPGSPEVVVVPAATPVQSVPGPGQLPQAFETGADLEARAEWNAMPVVDARPQEFDGASGRMWLRGTGSGVQPGDVVLAIGGDPGSDRVIAHVEAVEPSAEFPGWTSMAMDGPISLAGTATVFAFRGRLRLFGWNAPDPNRLVVRGQPPYGSEAIGNLTPPTYYWLDYDVGNPLEVDGDQPEIRPGTWLVVEGGGAPQAASVVTVAPGGATRYAISGPLTTVTVDALNGYETGARRGLVVHARSELLPTAQEPDDSPLAGRTVVVPTTDPPLPTGRSVVVEGMVAATGEAAAVPAIVASAVAAADGTQALTLDRDLPALSRQGLVVRGNVVAATHGETVQQVLGSADGRAAFATFRPRRGPLTYVRGTTPSGARPDLTVRVDGMAWSEVPDLAGAGSQDRVFAIRQDEGGAVRVVLGDGTHGARPPSGAENVTATYRVGIGESGAVGAGALSILVRRPLGIRGVTNPLPAADWAAAETMTEARTNAPLRVRTLDRVVSLDDYADLARGYAGVGPARADLVWDGTVDRVLLTVLAAEARAPSASLLTDLAATIDAARDPGTPFTVLAGAVVSFRLDVGIAHDPAFERDVVVAAVTDTLRASFGAPVRRFSDAVTAAAVLVVVRAVPGVAACTIPLLYRLSSAAAGRRRTARVFPPPPPPPAETPVARDVLAAQPGRWEGGPAPAQLLALADDGVSIGEMTL